MPAQSASSFPVSDPHSCHFHTQPPHCVSTKYSRCSFRMQLNGVADWTDAWETVEEEGSLAKDHICYP